MTKIPPKMPKNIKHSIQVTYIKPTIIKLEDPQDQDKTLHHLLITNTTIHKRPREGGPWGKGGGEKLGETQ